MAVITRIAVLILTAAGLRRRAQHRLDAGRDVAFLTRLPDRARGCTVRAHVHVERVLHDQGFPSGQQMTGRNVARLLPAATPADAMVAPAEATH